jgi:chromosome segregation ATPase
VKLWDAYKNQEESLSMQEKRVAEFEEKTREVEQGRMLFERDATARIHILTQRLEEKERDVQQVEELRQQMMRFDSIRSQLEGNVDRMNSELRGKDEVIRSLEKQTEELRGFEQLAEFKTKFEEQSVEFDKEKERLTKLFRLYEETESENKMLKEEVRQWQQWFDENETLFTKLFTSMEDIRHRSPPSMSTTMVDEEIEIPPSLSEPHDAPEKPKRRLRFRRE